MSDVSSPFAGLLKELTGRVEPGAVHALLEAVGGAGRTYRALLSGAPLLVLALGWRGGRCSPYRPVFSDLSDCAERLWRYLEESRWLLERGLPNCSRDRGIARDQRVLSEISRALTNLSTLARRLLKEWGSGSVDWPRDEVLIAYVELSVLLSTACIWER